MQAALYARVSTEEQKEGKTIDSQLEELRRFADEKGYDVTEEYLDAGVSGATMIRPGLGKLREDAQAGRFQTVLVYHVDRLARDTTYLGIIMKEMAHFGAKVIFKQVPITANDDEEGQDPMTDFIISSFGGVAQLERALIRRRTIRGRKYKAEVRRLVIGHKAPYGYRYIKKNRDAGQEGYYELIPEEAKVVRMIFDWVVDEGLSARRTIKRLADMKIPTRTGNPKWAKSTVSRILKNETYCGVTYYNKHKVTQLHEDFPLVGQSGAALHLQNKVRCRQRPKEQWIAIPMPENCRIISREKWLQAQEQLKRNTAFSPRNARRKYLLQGLTRCGNCDSPFTGEVSKNSTVYRCGNRHKRYPEPRNCFVKSANQAVLEDLVWNSVTEAVQNPDVLTDQIERLRKKYANMNVVEQELAEVKQILQKKAKEEDRLIEALQAGVLTMEQIRSKLDDLNKEKERLLREKDRLTSDMNKQGFSKIDDWSMAQWLQALKTRMNGLAFDERQNLLRRLLKCIRIDDDKVVIDGEIPFAADEASINTPKWNKTDDAPAIATTLSARRGRNTAYAIPFQIVEPLPRKVNQFKTITPKI